jgi:transposase
MRVIGMDIHRVFAEVVALFDGVLTRLGRVDMRRDRLEAFARSTLTHDDHVVVEATGNAAAVVEVLSPHVGRVIIANPKQVRLIADAKVKTDKIDAAVLAQLYASGFLPEVWVPDGRTEAMRRQVTRRTQLVRQRTRLKTSCSPSCTPTSSRPARTAISSARPGAAGWRGSGCPKTSGLPSSGMSASSIVSARS